MRFIFTLWLTTAAVVLAGNRQQEPRPVLPAGVVVALLAEGRVVVLDVATGRELADYVASPQPRYAISVGRLARRASGDEIFAVLPDRDVSVVAGINVRTLMGRKVGRLPTDTYPGLATGSRTGRIFAFRSLGATVEVLDPATGEHNTLFTFPGDSQVYAGAVSADERGVYVSYHGRGTGIESFSLNSQSWRHGWYVKSHGGLALAGDVLLAATGAPGIWEVSAAGQVVRVLDTGLRGSHLMEFSLDVGRRIIYAVGSCSYSGGFSAVAWQRKGTMPARMLVPVGNYSVCGERISASPSGAWVAVASVEDTLPRASRAGTVLIVDTRSGAIVQRLVTSSDVVDILAIT